jgi:hypothetical protein
MKNRLKSTVVFNDDLNIKYDPELIDFLQVYNLSEKQFTKCEHWGWNEEGFEGRPFYDFGMIADFHFDISKTQTRLYFGVAPLYGYMETDNSIFRILPVACSYIPDFRELGRIDLDLTFPVPETMLDLAIYIDMFIFQVLKRRLELRNDYFLELSKQAKNIDSVVINSNDDGLPF